MTPREKAEEIQQNYHTRRYSKEDSKRFSILIVDEIIEEYQKINDCLSNLVFENEPTTVVNRIIFWEQVKQELLKM
jgi:hypothetical protein